MNDYLYRGEIYYIFYDDSSVGSEQRSGRPGIIVSNDQNNRYSSTIEVVYLTTREKKTMPTHIRIETSRLPSTALCEQVFTVDKSRIGDYVGKLTPDEMNEVETGILISLGLDSYLATANENETEIASTPVDETVKDDEYVAVCAQRDVYKELLIKMIERR